jgi:DNA-3-methyladenine glycosylase II
MIDRVGPCRLEPSPHRFSTVVRSIISQQISSKAVAAIDGRLRAIGGDPHDPDALLALGEEALRGAGLSKAKARYILNLAEAVASGDAPLDEFDDWDDDAIIARLTAVKGIGRWTAEMFLIFALNRPDVLPVGDLGVRAALRDRFGLAELPRPRQCAPLVEHWRPFRTIAIWYCWRNGAAKDQTSTKSEIRNPKQIRSTKSK